MKVYETQLSGPTFNKKDFVFERTHVPAHDGEEIPVTIVRKQSTKLDRKFAIMIPSL